MAKVIKIEDDIVSIGLDDGGIKKVRISNFNFSPDINDEVEIFESESTIVVNKKTENSSEYTSKPSDINVNVNNAVPNPIYVANNTKAVNKVIYCILAFFMGWFGIHKFYSGKIAAGILYLIFFWTGIPAIIALVEFIIALCKPQDSEGNIIV